MTKLLVDVGAARSDYQNRTLRNLPGKRVQCDEIWAFVGSKAQNTSEDDKAVGTAGDVQTWTAVNADTRRIPCWMVGGQHSGFSNLLTDDLASRLTNRVQLTTNGHKVYLCAVPNAFGNQIDYAQLVKLHGPTLNGAGAAARYSPGECCGIVKTPVSSYPEVKHVSTSYVECANLTMRIGIRRFTRLTNAFSKKAEHHAYAVALHMMFYNFGRAHKSLRVTPAMEARIADHIWSLEEIAALVADEAPKKRGPHKKRPIENQAEAISN